MQLRPFVLLLIVALLFSISALAQSRPSEPGSGAPVTVQNVPLPVTVTNAPSVTISGTPSVTPSNTATTPLFVRNANDTAKEPFYGRLCSYDSSAPIVCAPYQPDEFTVPTTTEDGKTVERLVIEFVSGQCVSVGNAQVQLVQLLATGGSYANAFPLSAPVPTLPSDLFPNPQQQQAFAQQTTIYATPGSRVWLVIARGGTARGSNCNMYVNGHLVTH